MFGADKLEVTSSDADSSDTDSSDADSQWQLSDSETLSLFTWKRDFPGGILF